MYPADEEYRMPAEWELHERTLISWPLRRSMRFPEDYEKVIAGYAGFVAAIAEFEPVTVIAADRKETQRLCRRFAKRNVDVWTLPHDDSWLRDNGPTILVNRDGRRAGVNWRFNAWGEKYAPWDLDDRLAPLILDCMGMRRFDAPFVLEGGSIHVDGEGTLLTTAQCLLHSNRNPGSSRYAVENGLKRFLNVRRVIWLPNGLAGDETDGHIDNVACFAAPGKVLIQTCADPTDENYVPARQNLKRLKEAVDATGRRLSITAIPQPPVRYKRGKRLTMSYLNFYLVNGGVILPVFGGDAAATDRAAETILQSMFPDRRVRTVDGTAIIGEGGNVHCATQQVPAAVRRNARCEMS
ncbi:MAG: agmatine deiminase family protein [Sporolactobacillus sp.]|jgi:agmatine deiminase|nr:agmatine deiminase family protein [Sporolactobacillus sp.]